MTTPLGPPHMCHSGSVLTFQVTFPQIVSGASLSKAQVIGPDPSLTVSVGVAVNTAAEAPPGRAAAARRTADTTNFGDLRRSGLTF
ncbi:MAG: hypothetical protein JST59_21845 [Actinobacteria bacterium]|nr:hypothetical protein [Actinomycetota bacterium]